MRYSKQTNYPDWDEKQSAHSRTSSRHHNPKKRPSHSSARESKRCRYDTQTYDSLYSDATNSSHENERDQYERRYVEEYRVYYSHLSETRHPCKDQENGCRNHSSKSSGHSVQSSYKRKHKTHHSKSDHQSRTV